MSKLEAVHAFDVYEAYTKTGDDDAAQVYLKSEADKEFRRLKHALWLARLRALRDFSILVYFQRLRAKGKESSMDFNEMAYRIDLARVKCRAMAEAYK